MDWVLMHKEEPAKTVVMVRATRPEASLEREMEARGIRLWWARTVKQLPGLLHAALGRTIVVAEVALKDGNWRDLLEAVKRMDGSVPVLLLSSTSTAELWWDALECGVEDILVGPLPPSHLCQYLEKQFTILGGR
jgi:DNA-binding NtrC family response regulator